MPEIEFHHHEGTEIEFHHAGKRLSGEIDGCYKGWKAGVWYTIAHVFINSYVEVLVILKDEPQLIAGSAVALYGATAEEALSKLGFESVSPT
jgi:hypothetical protein